MVASMFVDLDSVERWVSEEEIASENWQVDFDVVGRLFAKKGTIIDWQELRFTIKDADEKHIAMVEIERIADSN
ncbi:MAG: hypothetical protein R3C68_07110 [Myxococcota bacterium]